MKIENKNNSGNPEVGNITTPLLPAFTIGSFSTTNPRCTNGHTWTYAGSIRYNLENHPCDCGAVLYHSEPCKCCGQNVSSYIPSNSR